MKLPLNTEIVWPKNMTSQQISEAQALAREWVSKNRQ